MAWYDDYLSSGAVDRSANPTPGNKRGGLTNIVEKALGSIAKSGTSPISGVFGHGERVTTKGLIFAATPASDFVCGTLQLAAAMNMHVFTTGRGTPYGLAMVPVIKVSSRTALAERWSDLIDIDAGTIATGDATIEQVGEALFHLILEVASGRHQTLRRPLRPPQRVRALQSVAHHLTFVCMCFCFCLSCCHPRRGSAFAVACSSLHQARSVALPGSGSPSSVVVETRIPCGNDNKREARHLRSHAHIRKPLAKTRPLRIELPPRPQILHRRRIIPRAQPNLQIKLMRCLHLLHIQRNAQAGSIRHGQHPTLNP